MKHLFLNNLLRIFSVMTAVVILTGCNSAIYDEEGDCDPVHVIRFNYDLNMKFSDAFPAEVPSVDLYVFDNNDRLIRTVSRYVGRKDEARNFSIELRGLAPGHYNLLAWCGVKDSKYFQVNPAGEATPARQDLTCRIQREDVDETGGHIRNDIGRLYHGRLDNVDMTQDEGRYEHIIDLTKNTNVIRVVLQHMSGAPMDTADYKMTITDVNGLYAYNNKLLPDMNLTYHPWSTKGGVASFHPEDKPEQTSGRAMTNVSAVVCEFTVGRLMEYHREDVALTVRNSHTDTLIFSIPLIDALLLVRGNYTNENGSPMSDQEYLDHQDEYPMTFLLDDKNKDKWINTVIYIEKWRVVLNHSIVH